MNNIKNRKEALVDKIIKGFQEDKFQGNFTDRCLITYLLGTSEWANYYYPLLQRAVKPINDNSFGALSKTNYTFLELMRLEYAFEDRIQKVEGGVHNARNISNGDIDEPLPFDVSDGIARVIHELELIEKEQQTITV